MSIRVCRLAHPVSCEAHILMGMNLEDAHTLLDRIGALRHPCDLDLLIFFVKHPHTLMASEQLASFMGYDVKQLSESLDTLLETGLITRSQNRGQVARMYAFEGGGVHGAWLPGLVTLASTRPGRLALVQALKKRPSSTPPAQSGPANRAPCRLARP